MNDPLPMATVTGLTKIFDKNEGPALSNITVVIPKGKIVGVVGPDGAGKTTLLRFLAGLLQPTSGTVEVGGFNTIQEAAKIHQLIGYMPQKFGLYEDLTVSQNMDLYADLQGLERGERVQVFQKLLQLTALAPFTNRLAGNLSGGMKQKLGLACTLIQKPQLLLLDEPSVGVDPISRRELWTMIGTLLHEEVTVVWSTSYIDEAEKCDTVLLIDDGKSLYQGPPKSLTEKIVGRTFKVSGIEGNRRKVLTDALCLKQVEDGVIQGSSLHLLMREKGEGGLDLKVLGAGPSALIKEVPPRFEDAFIDILGGGPGGTSRLADVFPQVEGEREDVIVANNLTKKFGLFKAVEEISFTVKKGEIFGLLGPNGAGKSTTFKMMCGLLVPTEGTSSVNGIDLQTASQAVRAQIGYMAQKFSLYGDLSVMQNLNFFSGIYGLKGSLKTEMIQKMVRIFSMEPYINTSANNLPLGFRQRLSLSCAVMHHPPVIFLDEPTSGVDPITRREFWNHINGLVNKGVTIIVTTHFMDEAEYCDKIGLVYRGKLIEMGTPDQLKTLVGKDSQPLPTLEETFIALIERYDQEHGHG